MAKGRWVILVAAVGLAITFTIFSFGSASNSSSVVVTGILNKGVEAGCIILEGEDGKTYELRGNTDSLQFGSLIRVTGSVVSDAPSFCMQGTPFRVMKIEVVSRGGPVTDYVSLLDALRAKGASVEPSGDVSQPFFSVKGHLIAVSGEEVQVFEYLDSSTADAQSKTISPEGSVIGTSVVDWVASPHFFKSGRLIVLYVGDNQAVISILEEVLGSQFAGR